MVEHIPNIKKALLFKQKNAILEVNPPKNKYSAMANNSICMIQ